MQGEPEPSADAAGTPESAEALARAIVDGTAIVPSGLHGAARTRLAWKLKEQCYAAWNTAPQRAATAATALAALFAQDDGNQTPAAQEIGALAAWTAAIAAITRGDMAVAVELLDAAAEAFAALNARKIAAQTQVPKIVALTMQGQHAAAAACGETTLREFIALGDTAAAAKVGLNLGSLHLRRDNFREAAAHYREASLLFARAGDREHSVMADIGLADALASQGDAEEALRIYARAAMRAGAHGFAVLEAIVEESAALLQLSRGDYREALAGLESARRRYEALAMPQYLAIAEKQLADAYLELYLLPEARALFDDALAKFEALEMPDDAAWTLVQLGRAHALLGAPQEADAALVRAGTAFVAQDNDVGAAAVALSRAELALARDDPQQAAMLAQSARNGFVAANLPDRAARASVVLGHAHLARGDGRGAADVFSCTLDEARALRLLVVQVRCLTGQGLAARALGNNDAARAAFTAAVELFENMRATLPGDEIRSAFLGDHLRPFQELLRCTLDAHAASPSVDGASAVLWQLDRLKARALGERLPGGGRDARLSEAPIQLPATAALRARLSWLYRRVRKLEDEGAPSVSLATELRATEQRLLEESRRLRVTALRLAQSANAAFELDVGALRERLGPADALVEYGVQGDELFACIVTRGAVVVRRALAPWPVANAAIRSLRFQIESLAHGAAPVAQHLPTLTARADARMRALAKLVWAPLAEAIGDCRRLLIVPHMELAAVPFAALARSASVGAPPDDSRVFAVVPSARITVTILGRDTTSPRRALVVGESTRLPHAADEAQAVAHRFAHADAFVGDGATLAAFHAHAAGADVIHLACHARFRADSPRFSALHLVDGPLTVETIEGLSLKPATVVLSACDTGIAAGAVAEMIDLVRAFLVAGAIRVVASLWPVDDATTAVFMQHFHAALATGTAPATALQDAQRALRATHPHPYYWAAFALYGRW